jgi:hypothetical protein
MADAACVRSHLSEPARAGEMISWSIVSQSHFPTVGTGEFTFLKTVSIYLRQF